MPDLDENLDTNPSIVSDESVSAPANGAEPAAESTSLSNGKTDDGDLLSVVRDVVAKHNEAAPADQPAGQAEDEVEGQNGAETEAEDDEPGETVLKEHPDYKKVLRQRRAFKERAEQAEGRAQTYEQDAVRYRNVQNFMDAQGLAAEEAADLLIIGGLMKTNPAEALRRARPILQNLVIAAGEHPEAYPDLAQRLQAGSITREAALEISRTRGMRNSMQASQSFQEQQRQQQEQTNAHSAIVNAGNSWEAERRQKDPNFEAKLEPFKREMAYIQMQEGKPTTGDALVDQFKRAYAEVNKSFRAAPTRQAPPQKRAITPLPASSGQTAGNAAPTEVSTHDIVQQIVAKHNARLGAA